MSRPPRVKPADEHPRPALPAGALFGAGPGGAAGAHPRRRGGRFDRARRRRARAQRRAASARRPPLRPEWKRV